MANQNDNSAFIYDHIYAPYLDPELTKAELALIKSLVAKKAKILDVGCGTGRHAIPLSMDGYQITGIDESESMLKELKKKTKKLNLIRADFLTHKFETSEKYGLIILMWNAFNEFIYTKETAIKFLNKAKKLLSKNGKILINCSDPKTFDPNQNIFHSEYQSNTHAYKLTWETVNYLRKINTTISEEKIEVTNKKTNKKEEIISYFKQRWWTDAEIEQLAKKTNLHYKLNSLRLNKDFYFILSKND